MMHNTRKLVWKKFFLSFSLQCWDIFNVSKWKIENDIATLDASVFNFRDD